MQKPSIPSELPITPQIPQEQLQQPQRTYEKQQKPRLRIGIRRPKKIKQPRPKLRIGIRRPHPKTDILEPPEEQPLNQQQTTETITQKTLPKTSTFTLQLTDHGTLTGLNIKPPKTPKTKKQSEPPFRKKTTQQTPEETHPETPTGIKGKLTGFLTKFKSSKSKETEESRISGILDKIKGIFKRK